MCTVQIGVMNVHPIEFAVVYSVHPWALNDWLYLQTVAVGDQRQLRDLYIIKSLNTVGDQRQLRDLYIIKSLNMHSKKSKQTHQLQLQIPSVISNQN